MFVCISLLAAPPPQKKKKKNNNNNNNNTNEIKSLSIEILDTKMLILTKHSALGLSGGAFWATTWFVILVSVGSVAAVGVCVLSVEIVVKRR